MTDTDFLMQIGLDLAGWKKIPSDSAIHVPGKDIHRVLVSVDVSTAELLLAKDLGCDAVIAHHPLGKTMLNFHRVFDRHIDFMLDHNVPEDVAKNAVQKLKERVELKSHTGIYKDVVDAAKLLKMPLLNIHQPCDEYMRKVIFDKIMSGRSEFVSDIVFSIYEIAEFKNAETEIKVVYGSKSNHVNKWALVIAAGTNGGYPILKAYFENGTETVLYLHIDYADLVKLNEDPSIGKMRNNLIILGHLAGDSVGLNALCDRIERNGIEVIRLGLVPST